MFNYIRRHLVLKLFLSYLVVIIVGAVVLATTAEFAVPTAFDRHMMAMNEMMMPMMDRNDFGLDLFSNFRSAVTEALAIAALSAVSVAIFVSVFISRQVVAPVHKMKTFSQRIAEGRYDERVQISGDVSKGDIDELNQLALSFNQMADKLEKTENMRRQLIGDVTHELRTPLTTIKGYMEGLIDGKVVPSDNTYQSVYREADRLQHLVDDLQELSRVEAGEYNFNPKPISPYSLVDTVVDQLGRQFDEKGVALDIDLAPNLPYVIADDVRIGQVLTNVVGNALQYTPTRGNVSIKSFHKEGEVFFSIKDSGIGISSEHLPSLFARFYRVDKSRSRVGGGSGIGLTISKYLVEAHDGRIWA